MSQGATWGVGERFERLLLPRVRFDAEQVLDDRMRLGKAKDIMVRRSIA
jgi:hypothetical protein